MIQEADVSMRQLLFQPNKLKRAVMNCKREEAQRENLRKQRLTQQETFTGGHLGNAV